MSKSGAFPFNASLVGGDSYFYLSGVDLQPGILAEPITPIINGVLSPFGYTQVLYSSSTSGATCPAGDGTGAYVEYFGLYLKMTDGTAHPLPAGDVVYTPGTSSTCATTLTDQVIDGTGWTVTINGSTYNESTQAGVTVVSSGGMTIDIATAMIQDAQSTPNKISYSAQEFYDTMGMEALVVNANAAGQLGWFDTNGNIQTESQTLTSATLKTSFACGYPKVDYPATAYAPGLTTAISFPDLTNVGLTWEPNQVTSTDYTGRLAQITLRGGGAISFNYNPGGATSAPYGFNCTYLVPNSLTRTTSDGKVTYNWTHLSGGGSQTTKLDIGQNETVYTFSPSGVITEVQAFHNTGSISAPTYGRTPDLQTIYCYNGGSAPTISGCATASVTEPVTQLAVFTSPNGLDAITGGSETYLTFDSYGNTTLSETWDYGVASTGTPLQETLITYGTYTPGGHGSGCSAISATIHNKPCRVTVETSATTVIKASAYAYSATGNLLTTYLSPNGGSSFLSNPTANSYNSNGTANTLYDLTGNSTVFSYSSSYYTDCSYCTQYPFPTKRVSGGLTTYAYYNGFGGVKTEDIDTNGNDWLYGYQSSGGTADPWSRLRSKTDPLGNQGLMTPTVTSLNGSFEFNSNNSIQNVTTTLDGYGRPINVQKQQSPSSSNYDTVSTSYNFSGVNPTVFTSNPCSTTSGSSCSTYGPTNTYDMLGRLVSSVQSGSNATGTNTYNENDVLTQLSPAPSGENIKQGQNQYDGLGRLTSSCAISSTVSGNVSCGQNTNTSASGILTTTAYTSATGSQKVTATRGAQSRSKTVDGLGRVTQKVTPEGGMWTYTYDTNSSCPSGYRGASGQLASVKDPNGNLLCYSYDTLSRVTGVNANGTTCRWFYYDNSSGYTGTLPSGIALTNQYGHLVEATTDACVAVVSHTSSTIITDEWFAYDKDGHKADLWELTPHSTQYYHSHVASFYGNGVPTSVALASPSLYTMAYGLDGEGRPNTLADSTANQDIVTGTSFFPATMTPTVSLTGSDNDAYTIDPHTNRIDKFVFTVGSNNLTGTLNWNPNGTLGSLTIADGFNSGGSETCYSNASGSLGYGYDDLARLVEFDCGSGNWGQQFAYDQYDNLTKTVLSGRTGTTWNPGYSTSPSNNHCDSPCTYDSNGDVTADGNDVYGWNEFSKIKWTAASGTPTCGTSGRCAIYDAFGRMVESSVNSAWKEYWYTQGGGKMVMNGTTLSYGRWPTPYGMAETVGTTNFGYLHGDWLGNSRIVSNIANNTVTADQAYTPYGEIYNIFGANNGQYQVFAGTIADLAPSTTTPIIWDTANRELSYVGRWLSPDPAGFGWNQYAYPTNPNSFGDPSGLRAGCDTLAGCKYPESPNGGVCDSDFGDCNFGAPVFGGAIYSGSLAWASDGPAPVSGSVGADNNGALQNGALQLVNGVNGYVFVNPNNGQEVSSAAAAELGYLSPPDTQPPDPTQPLIGVLCSGPRVPCTVGGGWSPRNPVHKSGCIPGGSCGSGDVNVYDYSILDVNQDPVTGVMTITESFTALYGTPPTAGIWNFLDYNGPDLNGEFEDNVSAASPFAAIQTFMVTLGGVQYALPTQFLMFGGSGPGVSISITP